MRMHLHTCVPGPGGLSDLSHVNKICGLFYVFIHPPSVIRLQKQPNSIKINNSSHTETDTLADVC